MKEETSEAKKLLGLIEDVCRLNLEYAIVVNSPRLDKMDKTNKKVKDLSAYKTKEFYHC